MKNVCWQFERWFCNFVVQSLLRSPHYCRCQSTLMVIFINFLSSPSQYCSSGTFIVSTSFFFNAVRDNSFFAAEFNMFLKDKKRVVENSSVSAACVVAQSQSMDTRMTDKQTCGWKDWHWSDIALTLIRLICFKMDFDLNTDGMQLVAKRLQISGTSWYLFFSRNSVNIVRTRQTFCVRQLFRKKNACCYRSMASLTNRDSGVR